MMTNNPKNADPLKQAGQEVAPAPNSPVQRLTARLEAAFNHQKQSLSTPDDEGQAVIERFLTIIGWAQGTRRMFESCPHAEPIETIASFRTVLFKLGFTSRHEAVTPQNLREEFLPCFIRTDAGRMLLVERQAGDGKVVVFDPVARKSLETPVDRIIGDAIFPETKPLKEQNSPTSAEKWTVGVLRSFRRVIRQIFAISFVINVMALAIPLYVMNVYDSAVGSKSITVLVGLTIGIAIVIGAEVCLRQIRASLQAYLAGRLDGVLNEKAFQHITHLSLTQTEGASVGSQVTRLRQMTSLNDAFTGQLATAVFDLPFVVIFLGFIALIGGPLVWVPCALIVAYVVIGAWALPKSRQLVREAGDAKTQLNELTVEGIMTQRVIKDLAMENVWLRRHRKLSADSAHANMHSKQFSNMLQVISQGMVALAGVGVIAIGAQMVMAGTLSAGGLIAIMALSWRVLGPIRNIFLSGLTVSATLNAIEQINRLARMPLEREPDGGPSIPRSFTGHIVMDNVSFRYPGQREPALRGVSLTVKPGELLCLYGKSGSGTSSALKLILGLYQQQMGSIFIDGLDQRQLDRGEWRHAVGVALQSLDLFHGTLAQNIRLAKPDASDEEIMAIVRRFHIDKYFGGALPRGLETNCAGTAAASWPTALKRRIVLARAFIKTAPVYLLDEPASTLDDEGEAALLSLIEERRKHSAIIMTTQRPGHMRLADRVAWMERGAIKSVGAPEDIVPKLLAA